MPEWHKWNGYAALVLIVFRILWGFVGGSTARFSNFVVGPARLLSYMGNGAKYLGHNPLGGLMVIALMLLVAAQATSGLFAADEDRLVIEGPLAKPSRKAWSISPRDGIIVFSTCSKSWSPCISRRISSTRWFAASR